MRLRIVLLALLALAGPATESLAQFPTARFEQTEVTVAESAGSVALTILVSGPANGGIIVQTFDGTAVAPDDYASQFAFIEWFAPDTSPKSIVIPIVADGMTEPDETFVVRLIDGDGVLAGSPNEVTVTLTDSAAPPVARFVVDDEVVPNPAGELYVFAEADQATSVTLRLDQMPSSPVPVDYLVGDDPTPIRVVFDGVQEQEVLIPSPPQPAQGIVASTHVRIVGALSRWKLSAYEFFVGAGWLPDGDCTLCIWYLLMRMAGQVDADPLCDGFFDSSPAGDQVAKRAEPNFLPLLRQYRDQVLVSGPGGGYYEGVYRELSAAVSPTLLKDPTLAYAIWRAKDPWLTGLQALVDGNGASVQITQSMQDDLLAILDRMTQAGDAGLAQRLATEISRMGLDSIAGLTMEQFQQRVETAGVSVPVEATSWSDVKARFGH